MNKVLGNKKSIAVFVLPAFIIYAIFVIVTILSLCRLAIIYT